MTTATLPPTGGRPARERAVGAEGRLSFDGVLRGEWIKLLSLRSIRWSIIVMVALSWGGAALLGAAMSSGGAPPHEALPMIVVQSATAGSIFTVLIMGVLGVLSVTSEYASGLILSSLAAVPSRTPLFVAKGFVVAALALAVGAISVFGGGFIGALLFGHGALGVLFEPAVFGSLLGTTLYLALAALLAFGIGALLRSSAGAIAVVVALLFVATIAFQVLTLTGWEWVPQVAEWMPASLGQTVSMAPLASADGMGIGDMGYWGALGGLAAWAAVALVPAGLLLKTRDAV